MTIGITGTTSIFGTYLVKFLISKKKKIIKINRKDNNFHLEKSEKFTFNGKKIKTLIHLAHSYKSNGCETNLNGTKKLFINAKKNNVKKIIFISSISAHKDALSKYGKTKYKIEKFCIKNKIIIIRPGLIFGYKTDKKIQLMGKIIKYLPIIPYFKNKNKYLYAVNINELVEIIYEVVKSKKTTGNYNIFSKNKIYFIDFLNLFNNNNKTKIQIPYFVFYIFFIAISKIIYLKSVDSFLGILGNKVNYTDPKQKNIFTKKTI